MFHNTNHKIYQPDYNTLWLNITNHINGALGIWYANDNKEWANGFGKNTYEFGVENPKPYNMTIGQLSNLSNKITHKSGYTNLRKQLMKEGYNYIRLIEIDGVCHMGVVLDFESIVGWKLIKSQENHDE